MGTPYSPYGASWVDDPTVLVHSTWPNAVESSLNQLRTAALVPQVLTLAANATLDPLVRNVNVDATAGNVTVTLPDPNYCSVILQRVDTSLNTVIIQGSAGQAISGYLTYSLAAGDWIEIVGTGTAYVNVFAGLPTVRVEDFGAVGDGTTDDSAAFQAAADSLIHTGGKILCGWRHYRAAGIRGWGHTVLEGVSMGGKLGSSTGGGYFGGSVIAPPDAWAGDKAIWANADYNVERPMATNVTFDGLDSSLNLQSVHGVLYTYLLQPVTVSTTSNVAFAASVVMNAFDANHTIWVGSDPIAAGFQAATAAKPRTVMVSGTMVRYTGTTGPAGPSGTSYGFTGCTAVRGPGFVGTVASMPASVTTGGTAAFSYSDPGARVVNVTVQNLGLSGITARDARVTQVLGVRAVNCSTHGVVLDCPDSHIVGSTALGSGPIASRRGIVTRINSSGTWITNITTWSSVAWTTIQGLSLTGNQTDLYVAEGTLLVGGETGGFWSIAYTSCVYDGTYTNFSGLRGVPSSGNITNSGTVLTSGGTCVAYNVGSNFAVFGEGACLADIKSGDVSGADGFVNSTLANSATTLVVNSTTGWQGTSKAGTCFIGAPAGGTYVWKPVDYSSRAGTTLTLTATLNTFGYSSGVTASPSGNIFQRVSASRNYGVLISGNRCKVLGLETQSTNHAAVRVESAGVMIGPWTDDGSPILVELGRTARRCKACCNAESSAGGVTAGSSPCIFPARFEQGTLTYSSIVGCDLEFSFRATYSTYYMLLSAAPEDLNGAMAAANTVNGFANGMNRYRCFPDGGAAVAPYVVDPYFEQLANRGAASGYASLDANSHVPAAQQALESRLGGDTSNATVSQATTGLSLVLPVGNWDLSGVLRVLASPNDDVQFTWVTSGGTLDGIIRAEGSLSTIGGTGDVTGTATYRGWWGTAAGNLATAIPFGCTTNITHVGISGDLVVTGSPVTLTLYFAQLSHTTGATVIKANSRLTARPTA